MHKRYLHDSKALLVLNSIQKESKSLVEQRIRDNIYSFESVPCAICGDYNFQYLANKDRYGLYYPVVICRNCGLVQTNPRMTQSSYHRFYEELYRKLYVGKEQPGSSFFSNQEAKGRAIYHYLSLLPEFKTLKEGSFVLEVGCGAGGILNIFKNKGFEVMGLDLDEGYLSFGKENHNLNLVKSLLKEVELKRQPDVIIYSHVLEHILDLKAELQNIHHIMHDKSLFYIEVPGIKNLKANYDNDFLKYLQNAHVYHFSLTTLSNLMHANHFKLLSGNDYVRSIFVKDSANKASTSYTNDYTATINILRKNEFYRKYAFFMITTWISLAKRFVKKLLKRK